MCPVICLHGTPWIPTVNNSIYSTAVLLGFLKDTLNIFTYELPESSLLFGEDFGGCGSMRNWWAQRQQMEKLPRDVFPCQHLFLAMYPTYRCQLHIHKVTNKLPKGFNTVSYYIATPLQIIN